MMETLKKYKWYAVAAGALAAVGIAAYTVWKQKKYLIPPKIVYSDIKNLDPIIHTVEQVLVAEQLAAIEGMAVRYYYTYKGEEREKRQLRRCAYLQSKRQKEYFNALVLDARFEYDSFQLIYEQICHAIHLPAEILKRSQKAYVGNKGYEYREIFNKQLHIGMRKDQHKLSEDDAANLSKDLKMCKESKMKDLTRMLSDELYEKLGREGEKEALETLASLMAYDAIYLERKLTEDDVREVLCYYNVEDLSIDEVIEI